MNAGDMSTNSLSKLFKTSRPGEAKPQTENDYGRQLNADEVAAGDHRQFVGGMWDEIGALQFEFLKKEGLLPRHCLIDIGCGCMRGGVHFAQYLDKGKYHGIDIN